MNPVSVRSRLNLVSSLRRRREQPALTDLMGEQLQLMAGVDTPFR